MYPTDVIPSLSPGGQDKGVCAILSLLLIRTVPLVAHKSSSTFYVQSLAVELFTQICLLISLGTCSHGLFVESPLIACI